MATRRKEPELNRLDQIETQAAHTVQQLKSLNQLLMFSDRVPPSDVEELFGSIEIAIGHANVLLKNLTESAASLSNILKTAAGEINSIREFVWRRVEGTNPDA